jgi:hypothetical protein
MAPPGSPSGSEVRVRLGWRRQHQRATSRAMPPELAGRCRLSASHVRALSQHRSWPLLACHARPQRARLAPVALPQGGVSSAVAGLAPQGGEPPMWCRRAWSPGLPRRSGGPAPLAQRTCEVFRVPLRHREGPVLAVLRDQQPGGAPAMATVVPGRRPQRCQAHSRRQLAEPLAAADAACQGARRHPGRQPGGDVRRQASPRAPGHAGLLPVPGLLPSPGAAATAPARPGPAPAPAPTAPRPAAEEVLTQRRRPPRHLRTRKGRSPRRLAGLEPYARRSAVAGVRRDRLAQRHAPRLAPL